jgi:hypothetical protein
MAIVTQLAFAAADQVQSRVAVTVTVPWPPAAGNVGAEAVAPTWHFWEVGDTIAVEVSVEVQANAQSVLAATSRGIGRRQAHVTITAPTIACPAPEAGRF